MLDTDVTAAQPFTRFSPDGELLLAERLQQVPPGHMIKGMFFQSLANQIEQATGQRQPQGYVPFRDYPTQGFLQLAATAAQLVYPEHTPRDALRLLGRGHYRAFVQNPIGRLMMSFAGDFLHSALSVISRVYGLAGKGAHAHLINATSSSAVIALRGCWDFPECHEVGVFEGVLESFQVEGEVLVRPLSLCDVDLALSWSRRRPSVK